MSLEKMIQHSHSGSPIFEITISDITEVVTVKNGIIKLQVFGDEGTRPHFHVYIKKENVDACILFEQVEWFIHGKHIHPPKFRHTITAIHDLLITIQNDGVTGYESLARAWNRGNDTKISDIYTIPRYDKLPIVKR